MMERRAKRSLYPEEALQFLVEAVADRSRVKAVALIRENGSILAGTGTLSDLKGLAKIAGPAARGESARDFDRITRGTDLLTRAVPLMDGTLYLAALGDRVGKMTDAARAVSRILTPAN